MAQKEFSERQSDREEIDLLISFVKRLQEDGAREDGHVPGLGRVPGIGHQVRVLGLAQERIQE